MKRKIKVDIKKDRKWGNAFKKVPGWDLEKIKAAKVMVVGAGALGNEVIKNLTLLNVGHIMIVDFDVVEYDNLAKSILFREADTGAKKAHVVAKNLKKINGEVKTMSVIGDIATDIGLGVFRRMDVVIGCLDNRLARMFINRHCFKVNKTWVDGALENLAGQFSVYAFDESCYECSLTEEAWDIIHFRMGCPDIAKRNASQGTITTTPLSSAIIAAFQVQEALKVIFGDSENLMIKEAFRYNGAKNSFLKYKKSGLTKRCYSHVCYDKIIEVPNLSHTNTINELLTWLERHFNTDTAKILLDEDIVLQVATSKNRNKCSTAIYKNHLLKSKEISQLVREPDEDLHIIDSTNILDRSFPFLNKTLVEIGIPFLDILKVEANRDIHFVELTGDLNKLKFT